METIKTLLQQGKIKEALVKFRSLPEVDQEDFFRGMAPTLFPPSIFSVLFRKLHPGKTYDDFRKAHLPPLKSGQDLSTYFPCPTYVFSGQNRDNPSDIITIGFMWTEEEKADGMLKNMAKTEAERHDNIATVAEKIGSTLIYKFKNTVKLGS